jgi:hypothetical protein
MKGKIYAIMSPSLFKVYIGSTTQKYLSSRMGRHMKRTSHCTSKQLIKAGDYKYFVVEEIECDNVVDLRRREGEWIKAMRGSGLCVNRCVAGRTRKESYDACNIRRREIINQASKITHQKNKDKIHARKNKRCDCECGGSYTSANKGAHMRSLKHNKQLNKTNEIDV